MEQKTVFITGAGSGIGTAAARRFAAEGWFVGLYDIDLPSLETLARELGDKCSYGRVDVTDFESVMAGFEHFSESTSGRLDVLVNNAGLFEDERFVDSGLDYLHSMMDVNMDGVVHCLRAAYPMLKATPKSHAVNVGSSSSIYGTPNNAIYSATKFFVRGLTEALRAEWIEDDITVNIVMPSYVLSPMTEGKHLSHLVGEMLTVEDVSQAIWEAATTQGMYWILPFQARLHSCLVRKLPLSWLPILVQKLTYGNKETAA